MLRKFILALLVPAMFFTSCSDHEFEETPASVNILYDMDDHIPYFGDVEDMMHIGLLWANADRNARREAEDYPSLQTKIEDLIDNAEDIMELPTLYPDLFELADDSIVRQVPPIAYACIMDTAGYFRIGFRLHKMRGHILASGQNATKESLTQVLNGEEPKCGSDYMVDDVVKTSYNKSSGGCGESSISGSFNNKNNKLDVSARIYVYTSNCCGVTKKQYMAEISTSCYYRRHHNFRWRGHHTSTTLNKVVIVANGLSYVDGGNPNDSKFEYVEIKIDKNNVPLAGDAVYKSISYKIGELINTTKELASPSFKEINVVATSGHIGNNKAVIKCN